MPTILIGDLFSIFEGILVEMANPLSHGTPEMKHDLRIMVIQLLFDINSSDPSRLSLLEVDSEFFEALNIG